MNLKSMKNRTVRHLVPVLLAALSAGLWLHHHKSTEGLGRQWPDSGFHPSADPQRIRPAKAAGEIQTAAHRSAAAAQERRAPKAVGTNLMLCSKIEDGPAWSVKYGQEFWRRAQPDTASATAMRSPAEAVSGLPAGVNLGEVIERVSHAIRADTNQQRDK